MSDNENQKPTGQDDLLASLLTSAAEKAAKREAQEALEKGFVTRQDINLALDAFGADLQQKIIDSVTTAIMPQVEDVVKKASVAGERRSTIATPEEERDNDPVAYLIKKGKELGPESYDEVDKRLIWGITYKGLTEGMQAFASEE